MISSEILHRDAVRRAVRASAKHVANPDSGCICHKCESARALRDEDNGYVRVHAHCDWTNVPEGVYCDTHADWVIFGR